METDAVKSNIKSQLDGITVFMATTAYTSYVKTHETDVASAKDAIVSTRPTDISSLFRQLELYGQLDQLVEAKSFFVDARAALESKLKEILEVEQQTLDNTKQ